MYKLTKYLFVTYRNRDIVSILQNLEGDWLLRGGTGLDAQWTLGLYPTNITKRCNLMNNWFKARQAGIEHALTKWVKRNVISIMQLKSIKFWIVKREFPG